MATDDVKYDIRRLRQAIEELQSYPGDPRPRDIIRILDGIVTALEKFAE